MMRLLRRNVNLVVASPLWREKDGVIYLSVTSDGTTGSEWIVCLTSKGFRLSRRAQNVLSSPDFHSTTGVTTEIAILKGTLFSDRDRVMSRIREQATVRGFTMPNAEVACLIREAFTDKQIKAMGLWWIVVMHEPIEGSDHDSDVLRVGRGCRDSWLRADSGEPDVKWNRDNGFAVVTQVHH